MPHSRLGLKFEQIDVEYGDSSIPGAIMAGGSQQTAGIGAAVIAAHNALVAELLKLAGNDSPLAREATKHVVEEGPKKGPLLDVLIIVQYQRMTHYGIAGFGTAAAYAEALGLKNDAKKLNDATKKIYGGDEYMTKLAETSANLQAEDA